MAQKRRGTPTSGPGGDENSIPVRTPGWPVSVWEVSNLKPKDVKSYRDLKNINFSQFILKSRRGNGTFLTLLGAMVSRRCIRYILYIVSFNHTKFLNLMSLRNDHI